jgi:formate hydrogenlyase transcriptional activator
MAPHPGDPQFQPAKEISLTLDPIRRVLQHHDDWYRDLVEHSQDLFCAHDLQGRFLSVNPVPARLLGYTVEEMILKPMQEFVAPHFRDQFDAYLQEIARTGESRGLLAVVARSGEQRIWEYHNTLRTEGMEAPIVCGIAHDVTDRVRSEKALRVTNNQLMKTALEQQKLVRELTLFRTLLDQSNDAIEVIDTETLGFLDVNETACLQLGYSREELLSMTVFDIDREYGETSRAWVRQQLQQTGCVTMERVHRRKDGTTFPVEVNSRRVHLDREYVVAVTRDVSERKRTEERLREFERVVENLEEMIVVVDRQYRYVIVNRAFLNYRKLEIEEVVGRFVNDIVDPELLAFEQEKLDECFQGKVVDFEIRYPYPGEIGGRDFWVTYTPVEGPTGIDRAAGVMRDITERKKAEEAIRTSEAQERARARELEAVLEAVPVPVLIARDAACQRITSNLAGCKQMRMRPGKNFSKTGPIADEIPFRLSENGIEVSPELLPMQQAAATGKPVPPRALTLTFQDGTTRETVMNAVPLFDEAGNICGAVGASIDLTELKRAEKALKESELQYRTVYERSPLGIAVVESHSNRFLHVNSKYCEIVGRTEDELRQMNVSAVTHRDDIESGNRYMKQLAEGELSDFGIEKRYVRPDGSVRWAKVLAVPLSAKGELHRSQMALVQDITERRQSEEALQESEIRFRAVYDRSPVGITLVDSRTGQFLQANAKFCEILDRTEEELLRTDVAHITHPDDVANCSEQPRELAEDTQTGVEIDKRYVRPDGSIRWVRVLAVPMWSTGDTRRWYLALVEDVTERRHTEQALRQSEERLRVAINNSPTTVFTQDRDLRYTWIHNPTFPLPLHEKLGKTPSDILAPEEAARINEVCRRVLQTGAAERTGMQVSYGGKKHYFDTAIEPLVDAANAVIGLTGASTDVTELWEASEALREAKKKLTEEKLYLEQEIDTALGFGEIIGQSKALQNVMEQVGKVASSDATVLLLGDTGTGKELVARAIHRLSPRTNNSFIKLNCAAIPSGLLESELFGHEKGAFTGAVSRKVGRLELAHKGTLFLDEIGEISLSLQPKLLRVLQDQEFERLGGLQTLKVDFRLIAATNRDLADLVRQNEFRSDLYYRLNVFPIRVPPLNDRREDIPLLVEHFVRKCSLRMKKAITSIPRQTMDALVSWEWPGNVRELENFIERSVILTQGSVLVAPLGELQPLSFVEKAADESLRSAEREHIVRALRDSHGQIGGVRGAATRLGLKRTTLQSKLKHLGINPGPH